MCSASVSFVAMQEPLIYREEVRAVMIAMADVVTLLRQIKEALIDGEEEEEDEF
jgi:hypothetical protein